MYEGQELEASSISVEGKIILEGGELHKVVDSVLWSSPPQLGRKGLVPNPLHVPGTGRQVGAFPFEGKGDKSLNRGSWFIAPFSNEPQRRT